MNGIMCKICGERAAVAKLKCPSCYYADRRNHINYRVEKRKRNFIQGNIGILTAQDKTKFIVDLDDFDNLKDYIWTNNGNGYARSKIGYLHRIVVPDYQVVDHINRDVSDNRKVNLREGKYINVLNTRRRQLSKSGYRGVYKMRNSWQAHINVKKEKYHLGTFDTSIEAAIKIHEFAKTKGLAEFYPNPLSDVI